MSNQLPISNVINISVSQAQLGLGEYNVNNLALFTSEVPAGSFGSLGYQIYLSPTQVGVDFGTTSNTYKMANSVFSQQPNILAGGGYLVIIPFLSMETLGAAITRTQGLVQYFGIMSETIEDQTDGLAAAAVAAPLNVLLFLVSRTSADILPGGYLDLIRTGSFYNTRGLYYGGATDIAALVEMAGYAGRALSTNFDGSNTTSTMHLKQIIGTNPDPSMTQALLIDALNAGADTYVSLQGVPAVFCSGANQYFDQIYGQGWFTGALQVAGFNYLAQSSTKIPQTEQGMSGLKGAYRAVCQQAVSNAYVAPGQWNSSVNFGNQVDFLANIAQYGYYIYSQPISQQSQAARAARQAPLVQIAIKLAGAIQSSDVVVYINP